MSYNYLMNSNYQSHLPLPITLGIIIFISLIIGIIIFFSEPGKDATNDTQTGNSTTTDMVGEEIISTRTIKEERALTSIDVEYPSNVPQEVEQYILDAVQEFRRIEQQERFNDAPYLFAGDIDVYTSGKYESFVLTTYEYTGGANGNGYAKTFVYNNNVRVMVDDVMDLDLRTDEIKAAVTAYLSGGTVFDGAYEKQDVFDDFYITDEAFGFIFSEYEIAAGVAGVINVQIPKIAGAPAIVNRNAALITSFESCLDAGGVIFETYPRQCEINETNFTEEIGKEVSTGDAISLELTVGPERKECFGFGRKDCLVVDGNLFYDEINGFTHKPGYRQTIIVERSLRWGSTNQEDIPQDTGLYSFAFIELVSEENVSGSQKTCVVSGCSSQLCISSEEVQNGGGVSTCEFREEYACYAGAACEIQNSGECGWSMTDELAQCIENPPTLTTE